MSVESLSVSELKVMNLIWNSDRELSSKEITETFEKSDGTTKATTMTFLRRLEKKGYINSEKIGRNTNYKIKITREHYINSSFKYFIDEMHNGSIKDFLESLIKSGALSDEEIEKLIDSLKKNI